MTTYGYKKKVETKPKPIRKCCVVCFKVLPEERHEQKRCQLCEKAKLESQAWIPSKKKSYGQ